VLYLDDIMILTLIGPRGTGKSTVAPQLAARLGWDWVDADAELERQAGRTIRQIFETDGEPAFRQLERRVLIDLLERDRLVLAAGGGAILNADTRRDLPAAGPVVWLQARPETTAWRLAGDPVTAAQRPKLTAAGGIEEIREILRQREPFYLEAANIAVATDDRSVDDIAEEILQRLPQLSARSGGR
jgi:shikimate kinase